MNFLIAHLHNNFNVLVINEHVFFSTPSLTNSFCSSVLSFVITVFCSPPSASPIFYDCWSHTGEVSLNYIKQNEELSRFTAAHILNYSGSLSCIYCRDRVFYIKLATVHQITHDKCSIYFWYFVLTMPKHTQRRKVTPHVSYERFAEWNHWQMKLKAPP